MARKPNEKSPDNIETFWIRGGSANLKYVLKYIVFMYFKFPRLNYFRMDQNEFCYEKHRQFIQNGKFPKVGQKRHIWKFGNGTIFWTKIRKD